MFTETQKKFLFAIAIITILFSLLGLFLAINTKGTDQTTSTSQGKPLSSTHILILGVDGGAQDRIHRADSIAVVNINPHTKHIGVLAIPRDCRIPVPGHGQTKINHAYAYGGQKLMREALAAYLQIPISYFVEIDMRGAEMLINQIGGVPIEVEKRMYYTDRAGDLYIDLYPGYQVLDGKKALQYVRFRNDARADLGRIERQQKLLLAIGNKLTQASVIFKAPNTIYKMSKYTKTNIPTSMMFDLVTSIKESYQLNRLDIATIPSEPVYIDGIAYMQPDWHKTQALVQRIIYGPGLSIEVLNGSGKIGMGRNAADRLQQLGYQVWAVKNASRSDYKETVLINWHGEKQANEANILAQKMQIKPNNILLRQQDNNQVNFSLVVGYDWPLGH